MLGALSKTLKKVFGDKSTKDLKEVKPLVEKVLKAYEGLSDLSNDELRQRTLDLKVRIEIGRASCRERV